MSKYSLLKKYLFISLLTSTILSFAQGEIKETEDIFYKNEKSLGIMINTNGGGINYRYGKRIDATQRSLYEVGFSFRTHPKETYIRNTNATNPTRFVYGKLNSFYNLKAGYGYQKEKYHKTDKGGISIKYYAFIGGILGILKPIYYKVHDYRTDKEEIQLFNTSIHNAGEIYGKADFAQGIEESIFLPGGYIKTGLSFDYSNNYKVLRAIEFGAMLNVFPKRIPIMALETNNQINLSLFISIRFGEIFDARKIKEKQERNKKQFNNE